MRGLLLLRTAAAFGADPWEDVGRCCTDTTLYVYFDGANGAQKHQYEKHADGAVTGASAGRSACRSDKSWMQVPRNPEAHQQ